MNKTARQAWASERYRVAAPWVASLLAILRCPTPSVDSFADSANHCFLRWWGIGGEVEDAFTQNWNREPLIWCNPPFSVLDRVVVKAIAENARMVLICPDWPRQAWWHALQKHVKASHYMPEGTPVFECDGKPVGPTKWGTWAYCLGDIPNHIPVVGITPVNTESTETGATTPDGATNPNPQLGFRFAVPPGELPKVILPRKKGNTQPGESSAPSRIVRPRPPLLSRDWSEDYEASPC